MHDTDTIIFMLSGREDGNFAVSCPVAERLLSNNPETKNINPKIDGIKLFFMISGIRTDLL